GTTLVYSTFLGGSNTDVASGIAVDGSGNAYVTGYTYSSDFPTMNPLGSFGFGHDGAHYSGNEDAFVAKITSKSGVTSLAYSTFLGGSDAEAASGIAVDGSGNAYVAGATYSTDFPTLNALGGFGFGHDGAHNSGSGDGFVVKINASHQ